MSGTSTHKYIYMAMMTALLAVCSYISLPLPGGIPVTMQTFAVFIASLLLGGKLAACTVLVYLCIGALGIPVFSGFSGGVGAFFSPTGGYLVGFVLIPAALWLAQHGKCHYRLYPVVLLMGLLFCYALGTLWFVARLGIWSAQAVSSAVLSCVVPYLIPDGVKLVLALLLQKRLSKAPRFVFDMSQ